MSRKTKWIKDKKLNQLKIKDVKVKGKLRETVGQKVQ